MSAATTEDLDDILNSALDELDEEEEELEAQATAVPIPPPPSSSYPQKTTESAAHTYTHTTSTATSERATGVGHLEPGSASASTSTPHSATSSQHTQNEDEEADLQDVIAKTIGMLGRLDLPGGGENGPNLGAEGGEGENIFDEAFLNKLVDEFEKFGAGGDDGSGGGEGDGGGGGSGDATESMVDNMVRQLLAKDLMYPPLKEVTKQFPGWLETNRGKVEITIYQKYEEQSALFEQIVQVYEEESENMPKLLDLMTKAQEYGQPPAEIVAALGVGGEAEGAGLGGLPGAFLGGAGAGGDADACCIM